MKKKDLINFEGKWKGKEKDSNGFGGREMQFLELAERLILFLLLLWLFLIPFENRARAADSTVVESVSIDFQSQYGDAEEIIPPEIKVLENYVEIRSIQYRKNFESWVPAQKVRVEVLLGTKDNKVFAANFNKSKVNVSGANFVEASPRGSELLLKLDYIPRMVLGRTSRAGWNKAHTMAIWKKVSYAPAYTVVLYGDDKKITEFTNVKTTFLDLSKAMSDLRKTYYYEVKATPSTDEEKQYMKDGEFVTASTEELQEPEGSNPVSASENEKSIDDALLEGNGVAPNSWRYVGRHWYFIDENGKVKKGWLERNGAWFFMDQQGVMQTGITKTGEDKYAFFKEDGTMAANTWLQVDPETWYLFGTDGYMIFGWWQNSRGQWYYMNKDLQGKMQIGWLLKDREWYYMDKTGTMQTGFQVINGKKYYFDGQGKMLKNTTVEGVVLGADGATA